MNFKNDLDAYFKLQAKIFEFFGYNQDWRVIPLDDHTDDHWMLFEDADGRGSYVYSGEPFTDKSIKDGMTIYGGSIYTQRFLPKWVYRAEGFTMVCADTHTDGNKFLMVFDNSKECTDKEMKDLYKAHW
jgi:hypothetical protein